MSAAARRGIGGGLRKWRTCSIAPSLSRLAGPEVQYRPEALVRAAAKGTLLSLGFAASAGNPLANTVSDSEANDQSDYNFHLAISDLDC